MAVATSSKDKPLGSIALLAEELRLHGPVPAVRVSRMPNPPNDYRGWWASVPYSIYLGRSGWPVAMAGGQNDIGSSRSEERAGEYAEQLAQAEGWVVFQGRPGTIRDEAEAARILADVPRVRAQQKQMERTDPTVLVGAGRGGASEELSR